MSSDTAKPRILVNVIDVESTCWRSDSEARGQTSDIIEIGITVFDFETLDIISTDSIIIKPKHSSVSEFCTELTTITPAFVEENGKSFAEAADILRSKYAPKDRLFASWGNYDRKMFQAQFELHGIPYVFGDKHLNIKALFAECYKLKKQLGMDAALRMVGIPLEGTHHRGADDSRNIAKLLAHIVDGQRTDPQFRSAFHTMRACLP